MEHDDVSPTAMSPAHIGRYEVERVLGRGAMGTVYLATDPHIQRQIALKTIHSALLMEPADGIDQPSARELTARFLNEARAAGRLVHPHIVGVYDYGEADGVAFIALEYVPGETLAKRLSRQTRDGRAIPLLDALSWFAQLLDALSYAHELGVVHRDIKPANLLITPRGDCKITDFGIAQLDTGRLTQAGMMIGTPSYMSPEQYLGGQIDARSDLFSAGVVLYEMLTGSCPFTGTSAAMMHQVINEMPPPPSRHVADLPAELDAMVMKALAKRPEQRFATALSWRNAVLALHDTLKDRLDPDHTVISAKLPRHALEPQPIAESGVSASFLATLEEQLASRVGPIASLLVRRAASQMTDSRALAAALARHLPDDAARREWDAILKRHLAQPATGSPVRSTSITVSAGSADATGAPPDPATVAMAVQQLAVHLGPIARIIVERAARGADVTTFRQRLVEALPPSVDRNAFLRALDG